MVQFFLVTIAAIGLLHAYRLYANVKEMYGGADALQDVSSSIRSAVMSFFKREAAYLTVTTAVGFLMLWGMTNFQTGIAFIVGSLSSLLASFIGIRASTMANARTAQAAAQGDRAGTMLSAFCGAAVAGVSTACMALLGIGGLLFWYSAPGLASVNVGFVLGAAAGTFYSFLGGGIFLKSARAGLEMLPSNEVRIESENSRNPINPAAQAGEQIFGIAGFSADLYQSFSAAMIGCMLIAIYMFLPDPEDKLSHMMAPFVLGGFGVVASLVGIKSMEHLKDNDPALAIRSANFIAIVLYLILGFFYAVFFRPLSLWHWAAMLLGSAAGMIIGLLCERFTLGALTKEICERSRLSASFGLLTGIAGGLRDVLLPSVVIFLAALFSSWCGGSFGVGLCAVSFFATCGVTGAVHAFHSVVKNSASISGSAHLGADAKTITGYLERIGTAAAAGARGYAIAGSILVAMVYFNVFIEAIRLKGAALDLLVTNSTLVFGLLAGAVIPAICLAVSMAAGMRASFRVRDELRRQTREFPGLMEGAEGAKGDPGRCWELAGASSFAELRTPALVVIAAPLVVGFALGPEALSGLLLGALGSGAVLAFFAANTGGSLGSADKYFERFAEQSVDARRSDDKPGVDHSEQTVQQVVSIGGGVGSFLRDSAGPTINILIKLMPILALLIAPLL